MCGGSGTRLWPASRKSLPKQFIELINGKSLFELTLERCKSLNLLDPIIIMSKKHSFYADEALKKMEINAIQILEEIPKNTCAAIVFGLKCSLEIDREENVLIMPSDHYIEDVDAFSNTIKSFQKNNNVPGWLTFGIKPTFPATGYGYINTLKSQNDHGIIEVDSFVEKPDYDEASNIFKDENFYWNSGIFYGKSINLYDSITKHAADIVKKSDIVWKNAYKNENKVILKKHYLNDVRSESIDYAVLEKEDRIHLKPFTGSWSDVGTWDELSKISKNTENCIFEVDSKNNFIQSDGRVTALIDVDDLIVINSDDATLVMKKEHSQKVKQLVEEMASKEIIQAEIHSFEERPWGKFENLLDNEYCKVKRLTVYPGKELSLQYHFKRDEHWVVVSGEAKVTLDSDIHVLRPGESVHIKREQHHRLGNTKDKNLIIIETQTGEYFGEDDIIRLDDHFGRVED